MARPGLEKNVKFRRLVRLLNEPVAHVRGYLECLWDVVYENGNAEIGDADAVAIACQYPGDTEKIVSALMLAGGDGRAGFIEVDGAAYHVHDLYDHAPEYVRKRLDREDARKASGVNLRERRAEAARQAANARWMPRGSHDASNGIQDVPRGIHTMPCGTTPAPAPAPTHGSGGMNSPTPPSSPTPSKTLPVGFEDFWRVYPKKVAKGDAVKAWRRIRPDEATRRQILDAIAKQIPSENWRREGGRFIPNPATWLNGQRWEDMPQPKAHDPDGEVETGPQTEEWVKANGYDQCH